MVDESESYGQGQGTRAVQKWSIHFRKRVTLRDEDLLPAVTTSEAKAFNFHYVSSPDAVIILT